MSSGYFAQLIEDLTEHGDLGARELADIALVSPASLGRWRRDELEPGARPARILTELHAIVGRLGRYYDPAEVRLWLHARHPQLGGERAVDMVRQGRAADVLRVLDRLDAAVFL